MIPIFEDDTAPCVLYTYPKDPECYFLSRPKTDTKHRGKFDEASAKEMIEECIDSILVGNLKIYFKSSFKKKPPEGFPPTKIVESFRGYDTREANACSVLDWFNSKGFTEYKSSDFTTHLKLRKEI